MATISDYLTQLQTDKQILVNNLVAKGVNATNEETFTSLVPKVADIQGGGSSFEITDASYLFYYGVRADIINELCSMISSSCTEFSNMFYYASSLKDVPLFDTSSGVYFSSMFYLCSSLTEIKQYDTSNGKEFQQMCRNNSALVTVAELDFSKAERLTQIFTGCTKLTNLGGFKNLGKAYLTTSSANYNNYKLELSNCPSLTHDSLMNVINNLYDIATKGCNTQSLVLGETNLAKLTEEEIQVAQLKGWSVS